MSQRVSAAGVARRVGPRRLLASPNKEQVSISIGR
jgi:hypothetical protein